MRAEAASEIEPEGEGLLRLLDLLARDDDPAVRTAAVVQLEDADSYAAVKGLLQALKDPDREVVLATIEALEFAGDESIIVNLEPLLEHRDAEIRAATEEAIDFLRD